MKHQILLLASLTLFACSLKNTSSSQPAETISCSTSNSFVGWLSSESRSSSSNTILPSSASSHKSGTFTDSRDGHVYKWQQFSVSYKAPVTSPVYMAENLAYNPPSGSSWCYQDLPANCEKYGRLYTWETAMNGAASSDLHPSGVQGICPPGWHIPSEQEWATLTEIAMYKNTYMNLTGWDPSGAKTPSNYSGFSALPAGKRLPEAVNSHWYSGEGFTAHFWASTRSDVQTAICWNIDNTSNELELGKFHKESLDVKSGLSIRCVQNK